MCRRKCDDRTDQRTNGQQKSYIPQSFFGGGIQILSKINYRNLKKSTYLVKVSFFPLIPFHIKKNPKSPPLQKKFRYLIKFDTAHILIPPAIQREGGYIVYVRLSVSLLSLPMQFLLNSLMELNESYRKSLIPYAKVH